MKTSPIVVSRQFSHSPEKVFDAWLNPDVAGKFLFATPDGVMTRVEIDPQVGGKFCIVERRGETDAVHVGTWLVIDRPRTLVFQFGDNFAFDATRVTIEIEALSSGGCHLTLTHEGVLDEWRDQTVKGGATSWPVRPSSCRGLGKPSSPRWPPPGSPAGFPRLRAGWRTGASARRRPA